MIFLIIIKLTLAQTDNKPNCSESQVAVRDVKTDIEECMRTSIIINRPVIGTV